MADIRLKNIPTNLLMLAVSTAQDFIVGYPDRTGMRDGVGHRRGGYFFYTYRTAKGLVVVTLTPPTGADT